MNSIAPIQNYAPLTLSQGGGLLSPVVKTQQEVINMDDPGSNTSFDLTSPAPDPTSTGNPLDGLATDLAGLADNGASIGNSLSDLFGTAKGVANTVSPPPTTIKPIAVSAKPPSPKANTGGSSAVIGLGLAYAALKYL